jgi:hypothetical protein
MGPIGELDTLDNGVMKLASDVCELTLYKTNGMKVHVGFSKGDFRYQNKKTSLSETLRHLTILTPDIDDIYLAKQSYFLLFSDKKAV